MNLKLKMTAGLVLVLCPFSLADVWCCVGPDPRPRQVTDAGTLNFPPPLDADFEHMRLEIQIEDMNTPVLEATQHLYFTPIAYELSQLVLDAKLLEIESVSAPGYETTFEADGRTLVVNFNPPAAVGERVELVTTYRAVDPPRGLIWTPESPSFPGRAAQIHTQGQPETNSYWFPCHDFPNDRLTTELIITSPQGYQAVSNGRLVEKDRTIVRKTDAAGQHDLVWYDITHWAQDEQAGGGHAAYLVSLVVGQFDVVDLGTPELPMPVYAPRGRGGDIEVSYGHTPEMVEFFERRFDEPYPWAKYAQLLVWNFGAGGMENTSATTMFDGAIYSESEAIDHDFDGLIAHELAHQWFGDLITCNSWEHIWLNEGFATHLSHLWFEHRDGPDGYLAAVQSSMDSVIANDTGSLPDTPAMASKIYEHPWETFRRGANPYSKGASVLHMLRKKLGDRRYFAAMASYIDQHRLTTVETDDFRHALEAVTGESLEQFFDQWVFRPGIPRLDVTTSWDDGELVISIEQTQRIDELNPAFVFDLPVWLRIPGAEGEQTRVETIGVDGRSTNVRIPLPARPDIVAFNHDLSVLCELSIDQPTVLWLEQLAKGPTVAARIQAARAMAHDEGTPAARLLFAIARDGTAHEKLRIEAIKALEAQGDLSRIFFLLPPADPGSLEGARVREEVVGALGRMGYDHPKGSAGKAREQITAALVDRALNDVSTKVRAASIRALGTMRAVDAASVVLGALDTNSAGDAVRRAALESLAEMNLPQALPRVLRYCRAGAHDRTRPIAIRAAVRLKIHDEPAVRAMLAEVLRDRERRASEAAAEQIAQIGGDWAIALLEQARSTARDPDDQDRLDRLIEEARGQ